MTILFSVFHWERDEYCVIPVSVYMHLTPELLIFKSALDCEYLLTIPRRDYIFLIGVSNKSVQVCMKLAQILEAEAPITVQFSITPLQQQVWLE